MHLIAIWFDLTVGFNALSERKKRIGEKNKEGANQVKESFSSYIRIVRERERERERERKKENRKKSF